MKIALIVAAVLAIETLSAFFVWRAIKSLESDDPKGVLGYLIGGVFGSVGGLLIGTIGITSITT